MNDIIINRDGSYAISGTGDLISATNVESISQRIYDAIMSMPPSIATGVEKSKISILKQRIKVYLQDFFAKSLEIDASKIQIDTLLSLNDNASFRFTYTDTDGSGREISYNGDHSFSLSSGVLSDVEYNPSKLSLYDIDYSAIILYREILEYTNRLELHIPPALNNTNIAISDIIITLEENANNIISRTETITIPIKQNTIIYPVSRHIPGFKAKLESVREIISYTSSDVDDISKSSDSGELVLVCRGSGTVTAVVTVMNILQYTK